VSASRDAKVRGVDVGEVKRGTNGREDGENVCVSVCVCVCETYLHPPLPHKHREVLGSALPYPSLRRRMQAVCAVADHRRPCQRARTQPTAPQTRAHVPTRTRAHMLTHMLARASRPRCAARIPDFPPKGPGRRTGGISRLSAATCCAVPWHELTRPTPRMSAPFVQIRARQTKPAAAPPAPSSSPPGRFRVGISLVSGH
jgi:hypothetical protein